MDIKFKKYKEDKKILESRQTTNFDKLNERFYNETKFMVDDPLLEMADQNTCIILNCRTDTCTKKHLDLEIYCNKRYTCNDPECKKDHYNNMRNQKICKYKYNNHTGLYDSGCAFNDCPLKHLCDNYNKCNEPLCKNIHHQSREKIICINDKNCDLEYCPLRHHCEIKNCNDNACTNAHYGYRRDLQCNVGLECSYRYCDMKHNCAFNDRCNDPKCKYVHDENRCKLTCKYDSKCVIKDCPLKHSAKIITKKKNGTVVKKENNIFSSLSDL